MELGPLEIQINSLVKSLDVRQQEIGELQQLWLRQQSELVRLCQDKDTQSSDVEKHKRQLTILSQKKIRTESEWSWHESLVGWLVGWVVREDFTSPYSPRKKNCTDREWGWLESFVVGWQVTISVHHPLPEERCTQKVSRDGLSH